MIDADLYARLVAALDHGLLKERDARLVRRLLPSLRAGTLDPEAHQDLREIASELEPPRGTTFDHASIDQIGDLVAGDKIIQQFFGNQPPVNGGELLTDYLKRVIANTSDLHLYRMTKRTQTGSGQDVLPPLKLADVYTNLVVEGDAMRLHERTRSAQHARKIAQRIRQRTIEAYPPDQVRLLSASLDDATHAAWQSRHPNTELTWETLEPDVPVQIALTRPPLALEAIISQPRLVLLGEPGYGKSTVLRYLALMLARHGLDASQPVPSGWHETVVPLFCSLAVAGNGFKQTTPDLHHDTALLWQALQTTLEGATNQQGGLRDYLRSAMDRGGVVLLLDGLDELSAAPDASGTSLRTRMSRAIAQLGKELPHVGMVVTCRVLPYQQASDSPLNQWQLPTHDGWVTRTIQPFAGGQIQQFVRSWYTSAAHSANPRYTVTASDERAAALLNDLTNARVQVLTHSPLLLTMLAIVHFNRTDAVLPANEAELYEECVTLLLERWEPVRTLDDPKPGLLELMQLQHSGKTLADIRSILHKVAFHAHNRPPDPSDGRGIVRQTEVRGELAAVLKTWQCSAIDQKVETFLDFLRENAALLHELDDDNFAFPHLTFQEFLAACQLADTGDLTRAYQMWSGADTDRWRKVLMLFAERLRSDRKVDPLGVQWLQILLREQTPPDKQGECHAKTTMHRQRDAMLALDSYNAFDRRSALHNRDADELELLERKLAKSLVTLLQPTPLADTAERLRAGDALAWLGDPRPGMCDLNIQWCDVPAGTYTVGSDDSDPAAQDWEKPTQTVILDDFRISKYCITNAQWKLFMDAGGYHDQQWWGDYWDRCQEGWDWNAQKKIWEATGQPWTKPRFWYEPSFNAPTQPVVGVSWYEAAAFCAWLSARLGYPITLPTEAHWEVAARGHDRPTYPWGNDWNADHANTDATNRNRPSAVGCYPQGASWCDALDIAGNVWEWTASDYDNPDRMNRIDIMINSTHVSFRGGSWFNSPQYARVASRFWNYPLNGDNNLGIRLMCALV